MPLAVLVALGALLLWWVGYELACTLLPRLSGTVPFEGVAPDVVFGLAGLLLVARGVRGHRSWLLLGLGTLSWMAGDVYWQLKLARLSSPPAPSWADAGYLVFYPLWFAGMFSLVRRRTNIVSRTVVADAATASLAVVGLSAAVVVHPVLAHATGDMIQIATNLAYPLGDIAIVGLIFSATVIGGWRLDRTWVLLAGACVTFWIADSFYLVTVASNTYSNHAWFNPLWYATPMLAAGAAWLPQSRVVRAVERTSPRQILPPLGFGCGALGILVWSSFADVGLLAIVMATGAMLVVLWRLALTWRENARLLSASQDQAMTDALTGLGNRRSLTAALEREIPAAVEHDQRLLVMFDLDGFKSYNDNFGHLAGDALLQRLGRKLAGHVGSAGAVFRMGGDEFCALLPFGSGDDAEALSHGAAQALSEHGDGFTISCSYGSALVPGEAADVETALRLSDERMYAHKRGGRGSASQQSRDVLISALAERRPDLGDHLHDVARLAEAVARRFDLNPTEVEQILHAGELHDVGKVAIPDAILDKPGPLDPTEWAFIRRHSEIGERIIAAAPALRGVAAIVRACHERFDGTGYPDRLAGEQIPLGARIVAVCDAFDAMTCARPYHPAASVDEAVAELRRCAGTQFDPLVVERFCEALDQLGESARDALAEPVAPSRAA